MARVKIEVDDEVVDAVFSEKDDFRLSVRGMTLMEAVLVEAIGDTFADGMPKALERLDWPSLVALAKALELIDADVDERCSRSGMSGTSSRTRSSTRSPSGRSSFSRMRRYRSGRPTTGSRTARATSSRRACTSPGTPSSTRSNKRRIVVSLASRSRLRRTRRARRAAARPRRGRDELVSSGRGVLSEKGGPRLPLLPEARLPSRRRAGGLVAAGREVSEVLGKGAAPPGPVFGMTPQRVGSV